MSVLSVRDLHVDFNVGGEIVHALRGVDLEVVAGSRTAIVGESGSGKTISAMSAMGLLPPNASVVQGAIAYEGEDLLTLGEAGLRRLRGSELCMVFQNALNSFNPLYPVGQQIADVYRRHSGADKRTAWARAIEVLEATGIPNAAERARNFPHEYSGGMAQRAMIAMALVCRPKVLIADEPTSGLDVTIQAQVLELIDQVVDELGGTLLLITHDIGQIKRVCDRIVVMYAGRVMEEGPVDTVFANPANPYTRLLLACAVELDGDTMPTIPGRVPDLRGVWPGCSFADRCPRAEALCRTNRPAATDVAPGHRSACHFAGSHAPAQSDWRHQALPPA